MLYEKIIKWEKYFFLVLIFIHLIPVLSVEFFVTLDGPAHTYHSFLLQRILTGHPPASEYMALNPVPVPYWTAQFILGVSDNFFSGNVSEKILIGIYSITFPLSFRKFISALSPQSVWVSYLVFPFIYSFLLYIGFYNFCIGLPVLFLTLSVFISGIEIKRNKIFLLMFLITLLYFSHLFVLCVFFLFAAVFSFVSFFTSEEMPVRVNSFFRKAKISLLVSLPALLLLAYFILVNPGKQFFNSPLDFSELLRWLATAAPVITLKYEGEAPFAIAIAVTTAALIAGMFYSGFKKKYNRNGNLLIIFSLLLLALYFLLPNHLSTGGFVSMRLLFFFYLFLFAWFTAGYFHAGVKGITIVIFLSVSFYFLKYHRDAASVLSEEAEEYCSLSQRVEENSILLPLDYSDNWMHNNMAAYLGSTRNIFVLDNFDAHSPHFPVKWQEPALPDVLGTRFGDIPPCTDIETFERQTNCRIDYITRWKYNSSATDSCTLAINNVLEKYFTRIRVSESGNAELFKRKNDQ